MSEFEVDSSKQRLMIAHFVDPIEADQQFNNWPLHVTLLPWFLRNEKITAAEIELAAEHMRACHVALGKKALGSIELFGDDSNILVRRVTDSTSIGVIHGMLLANFHEDLEDKKYIGGTYNPHLTIRNNADPGESSIFIDSISLIRHDSASKTVVRNFDLKK